MVICPQCNREPNENPTNAAQKYYCQSCDFHFNPETWCCPWCGKDSDVTKNPLDDHSEYYCYACNGAFNRLGPSFDPEQIEYDVLEEGFDDPGKQLSLSIERLETGPPQTFQFTLQNTGKKPAVVQGKSPIALQCLQADDDWWTIVGNPDGYTPNESQTIEAGESIDWEVEIGWKGTEGPSFALHRRLHGGDYRVVYWGIPDSNVSLAVKFELSL